MALLHRHNCSETGEDRHRPVVLIIPSSSYEMADDFEAEPVALTMIEYGCQAFTMRYSMTESTPCPAQTGVVTAGDPAGCASANRTG